MKKLAFLLPLLSLFFSFQASAHTYNETSKYNTILPSTVMEGTSGEFYETAEANQPKQSIKEKQEDVQVEVEARQTGFLIAGVVLFLGAMFIFRKSVKKSIKEKLN